MLPETRFLHSLGTTLVIEVPLVVIMVRWIFKMKKFDGIKVVFVAVIASVLTLPYLWFILPPYFDMRYYRYVGEGLVVFVEALIYWRLLGVKLNKALLLAFVVNFVSYVCGLII